MGEYRQFDGELRILKRVNPLVFEVELWLLNGKNNRNNWRYENLRKHLPRFLGTPLLIAYPSRNQIGDGHNFRMVADPKTGEMVPTFVDADAEHIVGRLSEKPEEVRMETRDGTEWIVGKGIIWKWYARELVDKIERDAEQGRSMSVSIETLVNESHMDGNIEVETDYEILGTTILGDHVAPAVAGARVKALQALRGAFAELKIRAASYEQNNQETNKPDNEQKGVKNLKLLNKQMCKTVGEKLPGYTVLSAAENDDGLYKIVAADENGEVLACSVSALNDLAPEQLVAHTLSAKTEDGAEINVGDAMQKLIGPRNCEISLLREQNEKLNADLNGEKARASGLEKKISEMETAEKNRRVNAAKAKAVAELERINSMRGEAERFDDACIQTVLTDCDNGIYTECLNEKGEWCGEENVCAAVRASAMEQQMKMDEARMNGKGKTVYAFEQGVRKNAAQADDIEALYRSMVQMP